MNTPTPGAIRPKSAPINPAVPVLLEAVQQDLEAVLGHLAPGWALWHLADSARQSVGLALEKIEEYRAAGELAGQADAGEVAP